MEALIIRILQGNPAPGDEEQLTEWRAMDEENDRLFLEIAETWALAAAGSPVRLVPALPEVDSIIIAAESEGQARQDDVDWTIDVSSQRSLGLPQLRAVLAKLRRSISRLPAGEPPPEIGADAERLRSLDP